MTLRFNIGCCHETASRIDQATELFKGIVAEVPSYTDAYMKLAYLAQRRGNLKRALDYIDQAKQNHLKDRNHSLPTKLYCMKARLLVDMGEFK